MAAINEIKSHNDAKLKEYRAQNQLSLLVRHLRESQIQDFQVSSLDEQYRFCAKLLRLSETYSYNEPKDFLL